MSRRDKYTPGRSYEMSYKLKRQWDPPLGNPTFQRSRLLVENLLSTWPTSKLRCKELKPGDCHFQSSQSLVSCQDSKSETPDYIG